MSERKLLVLSIVIILGAALLAYCDPAVPHSFYDQWCCTEHDCAPAGAAVPLRAGAGRLRG